MCVMQSLLSLPVACLMVMRCLRSINLCQHIQRLCAQQCTTVLTPAMWLRPVYPCHSCGLVRCDLDSMLKYSYRCSSGYQHVSTTAESSHICSERVRICVCLCVRRLLVVLWSMCCMCDCAYLVTMYACRPSQLPCYCAVAVMASVLVFGKLVDVFASFKARYVLQALITRMYRGNQIVALEAIGKRREGTCVCMYACQCMCRPARSVLVPV